MKDPRPEIPKSLPQESQPDGRAARRRIFRRAVKSKHLTWKDWRDVNSALRDEK